MKSFIVSALLILCPLLPLFSNTYTNTNYVNHIGFWAGFSTGQGISYRFKSSKWAYQVQFLPYYYNGEGYFSLGGIVSREVSEVVLADSFVVGLFFYFGGSGVYSIIKNYYYDYENYQQVYKGTGYETYVNVGIGPGIEVTIFRRFVFILSIGYAGYFKVYPNYDTRVNATGEIGLYYKF